MVFIGGWRRRRRGYGGYGGGYGPQPGYRRGGGSCLRDMFLLEGGCCIAELLGCGSQLVLVAPSLIGRSVRSRGTGGTGRLIAAIEYYQAEISPRRHACCRYTPTCSHYAKQALEQHGMRRGLWLSGGRLVRCRPGKSGGADPVPGGV